MVPLRHGSVAASEAHSMDFLDSMDDWNLGAGKGAKMDRAVLLNDITKIASDSLSSPADCPELDLP